MEEPLREFKATLSGDLKREPVAPTSARTQIWPALRKHGFTEFTDRVARRRIGKASEAVAFERMDRREEKWRNLPAGLFHITVGVYWPELAFEAEPRPKLRDCQLQVCLTSGGGETTAFASAGDAVKAFETEGLDWLALCNDTAAMAQLLDTSDWKILAAWPTMRGHGCRETVPRLLLQASLAHRQGDRGTTDQYLAEARRAITRALPNRQPRYQQWVDKVTSNLS